MADRCPDRTGTVLRLEGRVEPPDRRHRPGLHGRQRLTTGEDGGRGLGLDHRPQRLLGQLAEAPALPLPVVALGDALLDRRDERAGLVVEDQLRGLPTALQGARDHPDERHHGQPFTREGRLGAPDIVEQHPRSAPRQRAVGIRGGAPVPHEDYCGHADQPRQSVPWQTRVTQGDTMRTDT